MQNTNNLFLIKKNNVYTPVEARFLPAAFDVAAKESLDLIFVQLKEDIDIKINLTGKGASCSVRGVYLGAENEAFSLKIDVSHVSGDTHSDQLVRGILTDNAHQRFSGVIRMPQNSQKCSGNQNHRAVLLSEKAFVEAIPELEIYADDVLCSHGSAVGPLDKDQLFYLLSRGIDEKESYQMLLTAFVCDIVPPEYQPVLGEWLHAHI